MTILINSGCWFFDSYINKFLNLLWNFLIIWEEWLTLKLLSRRVSFFKIFLIGGKRENTPEIIKSWRLNVHQKNIVNTREIIEQLHQKKIPVKSYKESKKSLISTEYQAISNMRKMLKSIETLDESRKISKCRT